MTRNKKKPLHQERKEKYELLRNEKVRQMTTDNVIDWLAQLAHDEKEDWSFLRLELLRRTGEPR